jgi:protease PrsW
MTILLISIAPVVLILLYINYRDKYEKEPFGMLMKAMLAGAIIVIPVVIIELLLDAAIKFEDKFANAFYGGFVVAAFTEELFKYLAFYLIIWKNKNFNELFDGIIYAAFISLGFACVENIMYVFSSGAGVALLRAFTAVPGHALFGIVMGFYFGLAKFNPDKAKKYFWLAILVPIMLHGAYDFFLMAEDGLMLLLFIPFIVFLWIFGFKKMKSHSLASAFKDKKPEQILSNMDNMLNGENIQNDLNDGNLK